MHTSVNARGEWRSAGYNSQTRPLDYCTQMRWMAGRVWHKAWVMNIMNPGRAVRDAVCRDYPSHRNFIWELSNGVRWDASPSAVRKWSTGTAWDRSVVCCVLILPATRERWGNNDREDWNSGDADSLGNGHVGNGWRRGQAWLKSGRGFGSLSSPSPTLPHSNRGGSRLSPSLLSPLLPQILDSSHGAEFRPHHHRPGTGRHSRPHNQRSFGCNPVRRRVVPVRQPVHLIPFILGPIVSSETAGDPPFTCMSVFFCSLAHKI